MDFATIWPLIQQAAVVLVIPVLGAAGTYVVQQIKLASAKIKDNDLEKTKLASQVGVSAAQQKFKAGMIKDKKTDALEIAKRILDNAKVKYDPVLLGEIIEAQVWDGINSPAAIPVPAVTNITTVPVKPPVTVPPAVTPVG